MIHVVEDEENIRKLVTANLVKRDHQVVEALTVEQALKQLNYIKPFDINELISFVHDALIHK